MRRSAVNMFIPQIVMAIDARDTDDKPQTDYQRWLQEQKEKDHSSHINHNDGGERFEGHHNYHGALSGSQYGEFINSPHSGALHPSKLHLNPSTSRLAWSKGGMLSVIAVIVLLVFIIRSRRRRQIRSFHMSNVPPAQIYSDSYNDKKRGYGAFEPWIFTVSWSDKKWKTHSTWPQYFKLLNSICSGLNPTHILLRYSFDDILKWPWASVDVKKIKDFTIETRRDAGNTPDRLEIFHRMPPRNTEDENFILFAVELDGNDFTECLWSNGRSLLLKSLKSFKMVWMYHISCLYPKWEITTI